MKKTNTLEYIWILCSVLCIALAVVSCAGFAEWSSTPNPTLGGKTPSEVAGEIPGKAASGDWVGAAIQIAALAAAAGGATIFGTKKAKKLLPKRWAAKAAAAAAASTTLLEAADKDPKTP